MQPLHDPPTTSSGPAAPVRSSECWTKVSWSKCTWWSHSREDGAASQVDDLVGAASRLRRALPALGLDLVVGEPQRQQLLAQTQPGVEQGAPTNPIRPASAVS